MSPVRGWRCLPRRRGEVAEWLKAHAWNACIRETVSRVRIPLSPPFAADCLLWCDTAADYRIRGTRCREPSIPRYSPICLEDQRRLLSTPFRTSDAALRNPGSCHRQERADGIIGPAQIIPSPLACLLCRPSIGDALPLAKKSPWAPRRRLQGAGAFETIGIWYPYWLGATPTKREKATLKALAEP